MSRNVLLRHTGVGPGMALDAVCGLTLRWLTWGEEEVCRDGK
jgi:hypothetical protein